MITRRTLLAAAVAAIASPALATPGVTPLTVFLENNIPRGAKLKHPVVALDLGQVGAVAVAFYAREDQSTFSGRVATMARQVMPLPDVYEINGRFEMEVRSVFTTADLADRKAIVVLYSYYVNGTGQDEGYAGYVYRLRGAARQIDEAKTRRLAGAQNAAQARVRLRR